MQFELIKITRSIIFTAVFFAFVSMLFSCANFNGRGGLTSSDVALLIQNSEEFLENPQLIDHAVQEASNAVTHDSTYKPRLGQPGIPDSMKNIAAKYRRDKWNLISIELVSRDGLAALPRSPVVLEYELERSGETFVVVYRVIKNQLYLINIQMSGWAH